MPYTLPIMGPEQAWKIFYFGRLTSVFEKYLSP